MYLKISVARKWLCDCFFGAVCSGEVNPLPTTQNNKYLSAGRSTLIHTAQYAVVLHQVEYGVLLVQLVTKPFFFFTYNKFIKM